MPNQKNLRKTRRLVNATVTSQAQMDYTLGLGFPPAYDTWSEQDQRNYEIARLREANMILAGVKSQPVSKPRAYSQAYRLAASLVGPAPPDTRGEA